MVLGNTMLKANALYSLRVLADHIDQPLRGGPAGMVGQGLAAIAHHSQPHWLAGLRDRIALSINIKCPGNSLELGHRGDIVGEWSSNA